MAKASDNQYPSVLFAEQGSDPSTPASTLWRAYFKADGYYTIEDDGTVVGPINRQPRAVMASRTSAQTLSSSGVWTAIQFNATDVFDTDAFHDTATNNTRLTVPAGLEDYYVVTAWGGFAANATGRRGIRIMKNGATELANTLGPTTAASGMNVSISIVADLTTASDYVECEMFQESGGSLNTSANIRFGMYALV